ncbi:MAG TPA: hypothetical protein O0X27_06250 [Methanocorpusculum sp.]|nr:hypothetical protein [Methanocorpusculum sp.]
MTAVPDHTGTTRILQMRINPDGRLMTLHPADRDLETYLDSHGGRATVKLGQLLSRNHDTHSEKYVRKYHTVNDS